MSMNFPDVRGSFVALLVNAGGHSGLEDITRACAELGAMEGHERARLQNLLRAIGSLGSGGTRKPGMTDADAWAVIRAALLEVRLTGNYDRGSEMVSRALRVPVRAP